MGVHPLGHLGTDMGVLHEDLRRESHAADHLLGGQRVVGDGVTAGRPGQHLVDPLRHDQLSSAPMKRLRTASQRKSVSV